MENITQELEKLVKKAVLSMQNDKICPVFDVPKIEISYPKNEKFGDYTTNIAMSIVSHIGKSPMEIGEILKGKISADFLKKVDIVKPGYINFYLSEKYLRNIISIINKEEGDFGNSESGKDKKVLIEFISANPTGPIHIGNGRGGPLGDVLANILEKSGHKAEKEFYVNDFGNQVEILGHSVLKDKEAQYSGGYMDDLIKKADPDIKDPVEIGDWAAGDILSNLIKPTCEDLGIQFDNWFSEKSLHGSGEIDGVVGELEDKKLTYDKEDAKWYRSTKFGDDKDRVLIKSDGNKTYIATDLAYHKNKIKRGFDKLINIQGADHHKEVEVVKSFVENVLGEKNKLESILIQFVRAVKDGKEVKMSKRKGTYFAMDDLIEEVGKDAVRFIFLSYAPTTHINFDINLAKEKSDKNPVYYVQYAHARICSVLGKAKEAGIDPKGGDLSKLTHEKELNLIRELNKFPELIGEISQSYEVHRLPHYAIRLADKFHSFYNDCRVINEEDVETSKARLNLINAAKIVLAETLSLMGVSAPVKM